MGIYKSTYVISNDTFIQIEGDIIIELVKAV